MENGQYCVHVSFNYNDKNVLENAIVTTKLVVTFPPLCT